MVTLDRALFDTNEALHHMGVIPLDRYISASFLIMSLLMTIALLPLTLKTITYILSLDPEFKYFPFIWIGSIWTLLIIAEAYYAMYGIIVMVGSYYIILKYPQYENIKNFINKLF